MGWAGESGGGVWAKEEGGCAAKTSRATARADLNFQIVENLDRFRLKLLIFVIVIDFEIQTCKTGEVSDRISAK